MALKSCQESFQWQRWNCPKTDFYRRYKTDTQWLDPEQIYVNAIITAAMIYNINQDCANGVLTDYDCQEACAESRSPCSTNIQKVNELYSLYIMGKVVTKDYQGALRQHNLNAVTNLLRQAIAKNCTTKAVEPSNDLASKECVNTLRPFADIAKEVYSMYENAVQLTKLSNSKVIWENVPLDELVYNAEQPNYCEPESVPFWNGMRGRQCNNADSCERLCKDCGYKLAEAQILTEEPCNCKFTWSFQVSCEKCFKVEKQHYCY